MEKEIFDSYKKAGEIASKARDFAESIATEGVALLEISKKTEEKIKSLGGRTAFPINLSLNNSAAHYVPDVDDKIILKKGDLLKIDVGVHINGYIADTAVTKLMGSDKDKEKLCFASKKALEEAIKIAKPGTSINKIGSVIEKTISEFGFQPIKNLSGHYLEKYDLHARTNIPNYDNGNEVFLEAGDVIAIEPFATDGMGMVNEGVSANVFALLNETAIIRTNRDVLDFIKKNFKTLPFSKRDLQNKFGKLKTALFLRQAIQNRLIKSYPVLNEQSGGLVSQHEHTIIVSDNPLKIT